MKRKAFLTLTIVVLILGLIQIIISLSLVTAGEKVWRLEGQAAELEKSNRLLISEIEKLGSLAIIAEEAKELGMVRGSQVLNVTPEIPVALK